MVFTLFKVLLKICVHFGYQKVAIHVLLSKCDCFIDKHKQGGAYT